MDKLIITVALVGAEVTRKDNPALPVTPAEIAEAAYECQFAGASMIHLHVRKPDGTPTQEVEVFRECIELIRKQTDLIVQVSTGGAVGMSVAERMGAVALKPEMATITLGTVNFSDDVFLNHPRDIETIAKAIADNGVKPELEIFDVGMIANSLRLQKKGLVKAPFHFDFVMGVPGGIPGTPKNLLHLVETLPPGSTWSVAGIGATELPLATMAIILGGHVRVGFEDNIFYRRGVLASNNAQLVARIARIAGELGREVASPAEARRILGLPT